MPEQDQSSARLSGVRAEAREGLREGKKQVRSFLNEQKNSAAEQAHGFADALRDTAQGIEDKGEGSSATQYVERAAEAIDNLAERVQHGDVSALVSETRRIAQRSPALFIGASIVLGVLIGRLLRSSRAHDREHEGARYRRDSSETNGDGNRWSSEGSSMGARKALAHAGSTYAAPMHQGDGDAQPTGGAQ